MSDDIFDEELENPLVVHKKNDASYDDYQFNTELNVTHSDEEEAPTIERHRFRREKKKSKKPLVIIIIAVIILAVFAGLYCTGNISFNNSSNKVAVTEQTTEEQTTDIVQKYKGTIVVKNMFIFVDGVEVDGIEGLQKALKYVDASPTAYTIIRENANADYLNNDIIPALMDMGFYDETTTITTVDSTGLIAEAETTTVKQTTTKKSKKSKSSKKKSTTE